MKCEEAMERINDRLTGDLDLVALDALRDHLAGCGGCAAEARALQSLWDGLGAPDSETPSAALRARFERMLDRQIAARDGEGSITSPEAFAARRASRGPERSVYRAVLGMALAAALAMALGAGILIGSSSASKRGAQDLADLRDEIRSLRSTVTLALLAEPSASERLNGVAHGRELQGEDRRVADALFTTLLEDPNVNVRLAALDALREVSTEPDTRARLVRSISEQDSPLVQISAIDVLLESDTAPASTRDELATLAQDPGLDEVVRGYLRDRLERSPE